MAELMHALRREYQKMGKRLSADEMLGSGAGMPVTPGGIG